MSLEPARAALDAALGAADLGDPDLPAIVSLAKALVSETANLVSCKAIQFHGGISMTGEHDIGLFLKRSRVAENRFGSAAFLRDRFATLRGF